MLDYSDFELLAVELLFVASVVAIAARYLRVPDTVALVVAGLAISFVHVFDVALSRDLILLVFLPPLLFEGAVNMDLEELRRRWSQVAVLALFGTVVTTFVITVALVTLTGLSFNYSLLLAVMLSPTDPVSVLATMKQQGVAPGLKTIIEGESIFNDAIGIVLFGIAYTRAFPAAGESSGLGHAVAEFGMEVGIGTAVGIVLGYGTHHLMRLLDDHLVEITLSVTLAFGSFLVADRLGGSGVIAVVVGALLIGNYGGYRAMSVSSRAALVEVWEVVAFLLNSALFLLIGLQFELTDLFSGSTALAAIVAVAAVMVGRVFAIYGLLWPFRLLPARRAIPIRWQHAIVWGGLRGSIPIALVLGLAGTRRQLGDVDVVAVVFACVFISLIGQGLSFPPLLRKLGLVEGRV
jgi:CPA1 family monovalent cation:H+ antiporter